MKLIIPTFLESETVEDLASNWSPKKVTQEQSIELGVSLPWSDYCVGADSSSVTPGHVPRKRRTESTGSDLQA